MRCRLYSVALGVLLAGCGSSTTGGGTPADAAADGTSGPDRTPPSGDAAATDGGARDAAVTEVAPGDGSTMDGGTSAPLAGRWRVVGWDFVSEAGVTRLTDRNMPIMEPTSGMTIPFRVNGVMQLGASRLSLTFGVLANNHFYAYENPREPEGYSATGYTLPGLLDEAGGRFMLPGAPAPIEFGRNADGTITITDAMSGSRTTFARSPASPVLEALNLQGIAQLRRPMRGEPLGRPRVALLWDHPGMGAYAETHGAALRFFGAYAQFFVVQTGRAPAAAVGRVGGVEVALAYVVVYDDVNDNGRIDGPMGGAGGDLTRGFSPIAIAWRGEGTPGEAFATSPFADLQPGYQVVHLNRDLATGSVAVVPFDTTVPVNPDVPVAESPLRGPTPDLLR